MCILILKSNFRVIRTELISVNSKNGKDNDKYRRWYKCRNAGAPVIVSASRATDIPAFYATGSRKGCIKDTQFGKTLSMG